MKKVEWIKMSVDISQDEKIRAIRGCDKEFSWIWICLLTLAGKTNDNGYVYLSKSVPYEHKQLADYCGTNVQKIAKALELFQKLEMIEVDENGIYVTNWLMHQNGEAMEKAREQARERKQRERKKRSEKQA